MKMIFLTFASRAGYVLAIYLVGIIIESRWSIDDTPNGNGLLLNCAHVFVYQFADIILGSLTFLGLLSLMNRFLPHYRPPFQFHGGAMEVFVLTCTAITIHDFSFYWLHRLQHTSKWLWAEHVLHHSDEHVNITTSWRIHWLDSILQQIFLVPPVLLLFKPMFGTVLWVFTLYQLMVYFVHLNVPIRFGWFNRVLTSPQTHRIHHSILPEHHNKNYATTFPLWDILFGTYHHPKDDEWPETGVEGVRVTSIQQAAAMPFITWGKMIRGQKQATENPITTTDHISS